MLEELSWRQFEAAMADVFRQQGYHVTVTPDGADGGVDLVLIRPGERILVQCKHWTSSLVGPSIVRELYGVMAAERATGGIVATTGWATTEAHRFARGVGVRLIEGEETRRLVAHVLPQQRAGVPSAVARPRRRTSRVLTRLLAFVGTAVVAVAMIAVLPGLITRAALGDYSTRVQPTRAPVATDPVADAPEGIVRNLRSGSWITVFDSLPKSEYPVDVARERAKAMAAKGVVVVDTDAVPGLNRGFWALAIVDAPTEKVARATCAEVGRAVGPTCYPRRIG